MYSVYILECADGTLYTGIAKDVAQRFLSHQKGTGAAYTRSHPPVRIVYSEVVGERGSALVREHAIKSLTRKEKCALCGIL